MASDDRGSTRLFLPGSRRAPPYETLFCPEGGNSDKSGKFAADHPDCVHQGESVGIFLILEGRFVHESPDGKMRHHQSVEFLAYQVWRLAAQDDFGSTQVRFQFVQGGLDFPTFVIQRRQFLGRRLAGIQNARHQPINRLGPSYPLQRVFNHAHPDSVATPATVLVRAINRAQIDPHSTDPQTTEAAIGLTNLYMKSGRLGEAEPLLRRLAGERPDDAGLHLQLGRVLAAQGKRDDAIAEIQTALKLAPADADAQRDLADLYASAGKNDLAEATYRTLLTAHPNDAELHRGLGKALLLQKKFPEAQQEFLAAVRLKRSEEHTSEL